jgi:hypothetical protein
VRAGCKRREVDDSDVPSIAKPVSPAKSSFAARLMPTVRSHCLGSPPCLGQTGTAGVSQYRISFETLGCNRVQFVANRVMRSYRTAHQSIFGPI